MTKLRVLVAGTPSFGLPCFEAIHQTDGYEIVGVYTQPDRIAGRGQKLQASPIKTWAKNQGYPIFQPVNFKNPVDVDALAALKPDVMIVIAYGLLLPQKVLDIPCYGCINVHASLLPRWRGASPIQQAILHGDTESGVTIMQMEAGLDTGPILQQAACPITPEETAISLHDKLAQLAVEPLLYVLKQMAVGDLNPIVQRDEDATYAKKILKEEARLDWQRPAVEIERQIRAFHPWPVAYTFANEQLIRIYAAEVAAPPSPHSQNTVHVPGSILSISARGMLVATGKHVLNIQKLQFPGGKIISVADWVNTGKAQPFINTVLS